MSEITQFFSNLGADSKLIHALIGLAILVIGLIIVKILAGILTKIIRKVGFLEKSDLVKPIASLIKAILTIFVLMAVLEHFGLTNVLEPLKEMADKFLAAIPNIIGAGVVGYAGWVIAKVVSQLVGAGLGQADKKIALMTKNEDIKVSKFGSCHLYTSPSPRDRG